MLGECSVMWGEHKQVVLCTDVVLSCKYNTHPEACLAKPETE